MSNREFTRRAFLAGATGAVLGASALAGDAKGAWPFYVMDTGLVGPDIPTLAEKVALAKELGFSGIEYTLSHGQIPELLERVDAAGLELTGIYTTPSIDAPIDHQILEAIRLLKGRPTRIEMALSSKKFKQSDPAGDTAAMDLLHQASDVCADTGPVISVYPHTGNWAERVEDGVRLASKLNRPNVGTNFNLVHWKWVPQPRPLEQALREAMPHLMLVSINGLAGRAIVPLDQGDYDLARFLTSLRQIGYAGRVGLQGYGVKGSSREHLSASMRRWRELTAKTDVIK
jgi:sugar phosphate isomerase/epimerase